jgi:hypothetical protein
MNKYRGNIYQRGSQNPQIEDRQTTSWSKEKCTNNDLQNITQKTKKQAIVNMKIWVLTYLFVLRFYIPLLV